jgi:3-methylcrotonyl-CoA carboxylase alpha subunit
MQDAGVPVAPGYQGKDDDATLARQAGQIGYPIMVKAAAGGGGKGMRVVEKPASLDEALAAARREAMHAFGDSRLILERYLPRAHHVEFQVLGDTHGKMLHIFERECSVQRRHQKIIEETPSLLLDDDLRQRMGFFAAEAARAAGYWNAGTVEFIVNPENSEFFFLEMNTRLQVEHPITELVVGIDLAQWQIRIAAGEPLPFQQEQLNQRGHAIECRLYAEDPANHFLPATGKLLRFIPPEGPGIRVDTGLTSGDQVTVYYDPLIAKVIAYAEDRLSAIRRMHSALQETVLLGITTNWQFLQDVLAHPDFQAGPVHTTWVEETFGEWKPPQCPLPPEVLIAAALAEAQTLQVGPVSMIPEQPEGQGARQDAWQDANSPWSIANGFRTGG